MERKTYTGKVLKTKMKRAQKEYFSWNKKIYSLALQEEIDITRTGWEHIAKGKERSREEILNRIDNLPKAKKLIEIINVFQRHVIQYTKSGKVDFWELRGVIGGVNISVVIRQIEKMPKHFFSLVYKGVSPEIKK